VEDRWADTNICDELKQLLLKKANGYYLSIDLVAHMDYFFNTLGCDIRTDNPFKEPVRYPALMFETNTKNPQEITTVFTRH
jgi:hypothetical protein